MMIIEQVKALLGIEDNLQDNLLSIIQDLTEAHFKAYSKQDEIPDKLSFIIVEVVVKRFNKLGSEGLSSQSVDGLRMSFELQNLLGDKLKEATKVVRVRRCKDKVAHLLIDGQTFYIVREPNHTNGMTAFYVSEVKNG